MSREGAGVFYSFIFRSKAYAADKIALRAADGAVNAILRFMNDRGIVTAKTPSEYIAEIPETEIGKTVTAVSVSDSSTSGSLTAPLLIIS